MFRRFSSRGCLFKSLAALVIIGLLICPLLNQVNAAEGLAKNSQTDKSKEKVAPILVALGVGAAVGGAIAGVEYTFKTLVLERFFEGGSAWDWCDFAGDVSAGALTGMAWGFMCFFPLRC